MKKKKKEIGDVDKKGSVAEERTARQEETEEKTKKEDQQ